MEIKGCVGFVTGANRGIGKAFVEALVKAGAARIYAAARNVTSVASLVADDPGRIVAVALDITDPGLVQDAAKRCGDVDLVVNNAGVNQRAPLIGAEDLDGARTEMETNYFGTLVMCRAFAPVLAANGGGAIINVLSLASLVNFPVSGSYCASKAAAHSMTLGVRAELSRQGTQVVGVFPGPVDTDMSATDTLPKVPPAQIADSALDAVIRGIADVYPDVMADDLRVGLEEIRTVVKEPHELQQPITFGEKAKDGQSFE
jgi:NAD(P)-dependent dehydrogenase (short-subunit alcohol dehydrogenase family)